MTDTPEHRAARQRTNDEAAALRHTPHPEGTTMTASLRPQPFRKLPVTIHAMRWQPDNPAATGAVVGWLTASGVDFHHPSGGGGTTTLAIRTLEGDMLAQPGDWIIQGVAGEFYPVKDSIFRETYEPGEVRS